MDNEGRPFLNSRWSIVAGGFLLALMGGLSYSWGVFVEPMCVLYGWSKHAATMPLSIFMSVFALIMIPAGRFQDKVGPRKVIVMGALLFLVANLLSSLIKFYPQQWWLVFTYGVLGGTACGLTYACVSPPIRKWFNDKPGLAVSLGVMGFGIASFVFAPYKARVLIPGLGIPGTFVLIAFITSIGCLIASRLVKNPPPSANLVQTGAGGRKSKSGAIRSEMFPSQMIKTPLFWMIWSIFLMMIYGSILTIVLLPSYAETVLQLTETQAAIAVAIFALINGLGRPLAGLISDRFGVMKMMLVVYLLQAIVFFAFPYYVVSYLTVLIAAVCLGLSIAVTLALYPVLTAECFGVKHLGVNYGLVFSAYGIGAIAIQGGTYLIDLTGSYVPALMIAAVMSSIGTVLTVITMFKYRLP